jgi:protein-S-isoprenylcysteine O-methyltransferase Ste14
MNWKTASLIALVVLVACIWWLFLSKSIFGASATTITIQVLAISLMIWARVTFGMRSFHAAANPTAGGLVRRGPYKYIRHPIYAAILYFLWAGIAAHASLASVGAGLLASAMTALRMAAEEKLLVQTYPEYEEYARTTRRVVPFLL